MTTTPARWRSTRPNRHHPGDTTTFVLVAVTSGAWLAVILGILSIGIFMLPIALISTALLARQAIHNRVHASSLAGILAGLAVLPAWFGYLSAGHPGIPDDTISSDSLPNAWVFITTALLLIAAACAIFHYARHR